MSRQRNVDAVVGGSRARAPQTWRLAALLAALAMLGPFSIDMYLPAFTAIGSAFDASSIAVQQTLSTYLFAFAFMMLWHGAMSDAFGRRPIVIGSLVIYALASLGCAIAGNIESLWLFRMLQGISAGAGLVLGRAIIRDRFAGPEAQRLMSQITLIFGIAPALAPVIGGAVLNLLGWRAIFWLITLFTLGVLAWAARSLPETLPVPLRRPLRPRALWHGYRTVLLRRDFLLLAAIPTLNFAAYFIYIASAPMFLAQLGVTTWGFAWLFVPMITGTVAGAMISGRAAGRLSPAQTIHIGYAFMFAGAIINALVAAYVPPGVPWHVLPMMILTVGSSLVMPSLTLILLDMFPTMRGMASSLQGFAQFAFSGFTSGTIAPLLASSLTMLAAGMLGFTCASYVFWRVYQRGTMRAHKGVSR